MDEFELTYLPKELPNDIFNAPSKEMVDIYIPASAEHPHLRIRKSGEKFEITNKQPVAEGDASHQLETTIPLTPEEFAELATIPGKRIYKTRYAYTSEEKEYEVDVFEKNLEGLVLVDIEFGSKEEKSTYVPPSWLLADVTQETFIAGGMLCGKSYADIEANLKRFGYTKITR